jgi:nucleoside 2-deoxyribosyltransferase
MSITIYLAGAMDYVGDYAIGWRKEASKILIQYGYNVLDPTSVFEEEEMSAEEIAQKNLFMQRKSDLLLVEYMLQDRAYIGTDFEMAWAKIHNQPVITMCSSQNKDRPYMKYMSTKILNNLEDAVEYIAMHFPVR